MRGIDARRTIIRVVSRWEEGIWHSEHELLLSAFRFDKIPIGTSRCLGMASTGMSFSAPSPPICRRWHVVGSTSRFFLPLLWIRFFVLHLDQNGKLRIRSSATMWLYKDREFSLRGLAALLLRLRWLRTAWQITGCKNLVLRTTRCPRRQVLALCISSFIIS